MDLQTSECPGICSTTLPYGDDDCGEFYLGKTPYTRPINLFDRWLGKIARLRAPSVASQICHKYMNQRSSHVTGIPPDAPILWRNRCQLKPYRLYNLFFEH